MNFDDVYAVAQFSFRKMRMRPISKGTTHNKYMCLALTAILAGKEAPMAGLRRQRRSSLAFTGMRKKSPELN